jgi:hypothetical protein
MRDKCATAHGTSSARRAHGTGSQLRQPVRTTLHSRIGGIEVARRARSIEQVLFPSLALRGSSDRLFLLPRGGALLFEQLQGAPRAFLVGG